MVGSLCSAVSVLGWGAVLFSRIPLVFSVWGELGRFFIEVFGGLLIGTCNSKSVIKGKKIKNLDYSKVGESAHLRKEEEDRNRQLVL